jgi:hypothetical protein
LELGAAPEKLLEMMRLDLHLITLDYAIVVPPERGTTNRRLVWIPGGYHAAWVTMTLHVEGISCYYGVK